jgi:hypothetical protein
MKMKPAIKITTATLVCVLGAGLVSAQNPTIIQNVRGTMNGVSSQQTSASNQALGVHQSSSTSVATATGAPHASAHAVAPAPAKHAAPPASAAPAPAAPKMSAVGVRAVPSARQTAKHTNRRTRGGAVPVGNAPGTGDVAPSDPSAAETSASVGASAPSTGGDEYAPSEQSVVPDGKYAANGRRDPFISPVVSHAGGSGCSTGKKCLEIGAINLRGVVHSENGFIAVVSNGLNKAYFLRENDPVFNGYVVKITGDSIVFQETLQDRLGKSFTREVVKKITTPAV